VSSSARLEVVPWLPEGFSAFCGRQMALHFNNIGLTDRAILVLLLILVLVLYYSLAFNFIFYIIVVFFCIDTFSLYLVVRK